jgi:hypothetical protein
MSRLTSFLYDINRNLDNLDPMMTMVAHAGEAVLVHAPPT